MINSRTVVCVTYLLLAGCANEDMSDLQHYVAEIKAREPDPVAPLPEIKPPETYLYQSAERRDPFSLGGVVFEEQIAQSNNGIAPNATRRKEELEQFPLDGLRMVGTLNQRNEDWGLVTAPDGSLYRVRAGNYMGQNHGQITRVTEDRIELTEIIPDDQGGWRERPSKVGLSQ